MSLFIYRDYKRFREIVKGRIRKDLRRYMSQRDLIVPRGRGAVSVPVPHIDLPHFRFDDKASGGVGQGDGEPGTPIAPGEPEPGSGAAGDQPGQHLLEVELTYEELVELLAEALELPRIKPRGQDDIYTERLRYTGIAPVGPESLRHFKPSYREALKRALISGEYQPDNPIVIPIKEDMRYHSWSRRQQPQARAVIIYIMDVSGSMGFEQKDIVRSESFWIDLWIRHHYRKTETVYIVHDVVAHEVSREVFFHLREGGGTRISSAFYLADQIIDKRYPPDDWNIYLFQFSDGDNWNGGDSDACVKVLTEKFLPTVNLFCYGQVRSAYGSGEFYFNLEPLAKDHDNLILSRINDREEILDSIKAFLGKGR